MTQYFCFLCKESKESSLKKRKLLFCPQCRISPLYPIAKLLYSQVRRAEKANLPATLTLEQWLSTIDFFEGMCAYCQVLPYTCMDHFIPFEHGGGTTWNNMVPACAGCNHRKGSWYPEQKLEPDELERVRTYLFMRPRMEVAS